MSRFHAPVSAYMSSPVFTLPATAVLEDAERMMEARSVSSLAVIDEQGALQGVLSRTDLLHIGRRLASSDPAAPAALLPLPPLTVRDAMVKDVVTVTPATPLSAACTRMLEHHIHRVFVVAAGAPVGVVSTRDVMRAVADERTPGALGQLMSRPVLTVEAGATVAEATDRLAQAHVRGLIVIDYEWPVGIFTQTEALQARDRPPTTPVDEVMNAALLCLPEGLPLFRAAGFALATRARRILAVEARQMRGVVSGVDFVRVVAG